MRRILFLLLASLLIAPPGIRHRLVAQETSHMDPDATPIEVSDLESSLEAGLSAEDIAGTNAWVNTLGLADWLGPLAPIALSPFFGVTCLSGLALWGPEWATDNQLLGESAPLKNPLLFFVFLALTLLSSLPRLTKVSKPFAQAVDRLETYAVIIILLAIKFSISTATEGETPVAMVQLGVFSLTIDTLLAMAMIVNILVINSVKFFFEFLVWLTPVPFLDAVFEICNKSVCVTLMATYTLSPTLATVVNLAILLAAAIMIRWISRRTRFYRSMLLEPLLAKCWPAFGKPRKQELIVFPVDDFGPHPAKSRLRLTVDPEANNVWKFSSANWWASKTEYKLQCDTPPRVTLGWVMNTIEISQADTEPIIIRFSRRHDQVTLAELLKQLHLTIHMPAGEASQPSVIDRKAEFA